VKRLVLLDNEAVQALGVGPTHRTHSRVIYELKTVNRRVARAQQVAAAVPAAVRVEAGWDRTDPAWALVNRLRITDIPLDPRHADAAAALRRRTGVSVADAHLGAAIAHAEQDGITVVTSDPDDMRKVAQDRRVDIVTI
jgi:predicted nucleic acid-binding protein